MPLTPLGFLFHKAFLPRETGYGEKGTRVAITPRQGETVFVFKTDHEGFDDHFGIGRNEARSDALLLYIREDHGKLIKRRLLFLEMKGKHHERAIDQLDRTICAVKDKLTPLLGKPFFDVSNLRALIVSQTGSPPNLHKKLDAFARKHGFPPRLCRPDEAELRKHLD